MTISTNFPKIRFTVLVNIVEVLERLRGPKASDIRKLEKMEFGETEIAELKDKQEAELL